MNTIQINYDLSKPVRDYPRVYEYLVAYGTRARPLQSLWFVKTNKTASTVRDELMKLVDKDDKILTADVTGDWWATSFSDKNSKWMIDHMPVSDAPPAQRAA